MKAVYELAESDIRSAISAYLLATKKADIDTRAIVFEVHFDVRDPAVTTISATAPECSPGQR